MGLHYLKRLPHRVLQSLRPVDLHAGSRILDVGSGAGGYLRDLGDLGFRDVLGIDPGLPEDVVHDNGVRILRRSLPETDGPFDLIMFHHSFEHVPDPATVLRQTVERLAPNGTCLLRMPTVSSEAWGCYGVNWVQLDAPRHLVLHSDDSIRILAEQVGLAVSEVIDDSTAFQFWGSEQYARNIPLNAPNSYGEDPEGSPFSREDIDGFVRRAAEVNARRRGDQAAYYLKRS